MSVVWECPEVEVRTTPDGERLRVSAGDWQMGGEPGEITRDEVVGLRDALTEWLMENPR